MAKSKRLSDDIADVILSMITVEKKYNPGDKLPNEMELSEQLGVSRITLREAIRILVTANVLEIKRGKGTFVKEDFKQYTFKGLEVGSTAKVGLNDLYEMRLIFEPEVAYYATLRATEKEIERILSISEKIEKLIRKGIDYEEEEKAFHCSIAKATHNEFINQLEPVLQQSIQKGVYIYEHENLEMEEILSDHKLIKDFMKNRNPEGAKNAMKVHIIHAIERLGLDNK